ncbi:hypothetical protein F5Y16DRAFT_373883, partial [Xylariaceae sp. FL0255]
MTGNSTGGNHDGSPTTSSNSTIPSSKPLALGLGIGLSIPLAAAIIALIILLRRRQHGPHDFNPSSLAFAPFTDQPISERPANMLLAARRDGSRRKAAFHPQPNDGPLSQNPTAPHDENLPRLSELDDTSPLYELDPFPTPTPITEGLSFLTSNNSRNVTPQGSVSPPHPSMSPLSTATMSPVFSGLIPPVSPSPPLSTRASASNIVFTTPGASATNLEGFRPSSGN